MLARKKIDLAEQNGPKSEPKIPPKKKVVDVLPSMFPAPPVGLPLTFAAQRRHAENTRRLLHPDIFTRVVYHMSLPSVYNFMRTNHAAYKLAGARLYRLLPDLNPDRYKSPYGPYTGVEVGLEPPKYGKLIVLGKTSRIDRDPDPHRLRYLPTQVILDTDINPKFLAPPTPTPLQLEPKAFMWRDHTIPVEPKPLKLPVHGRSTFEKPPLGNTKDDLLKHTRVIELSARSHFQLELLAKRRILDLPALQAIYHHGWTYEYPKHLPSTSRWRTLDGHEDITLYVRAGRALGHHMNKTVRSEMAQHFNDTAIKRFVLLLDPPNVMPTPDLIAQENYFLRHLPPHIQHFYLVLVPRDDRDTWDFPGFHIFRLWTNQLAIVGRIVSEAAICPRITVVGLDQYPQFRVPFSYSIGKTMDDAGRRMLATIESTPPFSRCSVGRLKRKVKFVSMAEYVDTTLQPEMRGMGASWIRERLI